MGSEKNSQNIAGFTCCQNALSPPQNTGQTIGACVKKAPSK